MKNIIFPRHKKFNDIFVSSFRHKPVFFRYFLGILSGLLAFLAFPPGHLSLLAWFALIPLLYAVDGCTLYRAFCYSYIAGIVFFATVLYWLILVSVPGYIILVFVLALFYGIFGVFSRSVLARKVNLIAIPLFWVVLEYIRSNLFTGFPWALLGHSQYLNTNIIQISDVTGAYGVSFILVFFNVAVYGFLSGSSKKVTYLMSALFLIIVSTSYGIYRIDNIEHDTGPRISVVQGNIRQEDKWDRHSAGHIKGKYAELTRKASADSPDLVIWPETSYPYLLTYPDIAYSYMPGLAEELKVSIMAGIVYGHDENVYNSAVFLQDGSSSPEVYKKVHLVPFGEYIPFEDHLGPLRSYIDKPIGDFTPGNKMSTFTLRSTRRSVGSGSSLLRETLFTKIGVMICFEDVFPYIARGLVLEGASFLVNITNDAWFGYTAASRQHLQSSVFRAVENRVPVARAANTGISCFIDPIGRISGIVMHEDEEIFVEGFSSKDIEIARTGSYYTTNGDIFIYLAGLFLALLLLKNKFTHLPQR